MTQFVLIVLALGALANSAITMNETIVEIDRNGDGLMTIDEVQAVFPDVSTETFSELDVNDDGALDDEEMVAGQAQGLIPVATDG